MNREVRKSHTRAVLLGVQDADNCFDFRGAAGEATPESPYFIASATKMVTAAVLMELADEKRLEPNAPLENYRPDGLLRALPVHQSKDERARLRVYQLIEQTSGLPDYFAGRLAKDFSANHDRAYTVADTLAMARQKRRSVYVKGRGGGDERA